MKELEQFDALFEKHPNIAILNINNCCDDIKNKLQQIVDDIGGSFTNKELEDIDEKRFRLKAREFEYAVVCDTLQNLENQERFMDQIYHCLENSGQVIVISKKENMDISQLMEMLEKYDFRAANSIDIFDKYNLVMGKKMHMWGNGL
ncbi:MAG: hypothetical protein U9Q33_09760 [Campylobacterota bacterium]|nr:hypothetical protein [Campylobacterota bacterium]